MTLAEMFLPEFEREMAGTRKTIERIPDDKLSWKAHPKSNTIGWVGSHLAEIAGWTEGTLTGDSFDISPPGSPPYVTPELPTTAAILELFDKNVAAAKKAIAATSDDAFMQPWSLLYQGQTVFTMPRHSVIRGFVISHSIHHRAFLCSYLRQLDIPLPALYGPSGDEES